jgi:hypothetical protein
MLPTLLVTFACVSGQRPSEIPQPQIQIRQVGGPESTGVTRNLTGGMPVRLQITVANPSSKTIRVEKLEIHSVGMGAFEVPNASRPVNQSIASGQAGLIDFWTAAYSQGSISGPAGPVTLRLTLYFSSDLGDFREVYTETVNTSRTPRTDPQ